MALSHSPKIITDGLVLCLDAANPRSYPGSGTVWKDLSGNGNDGTLVNGVGHNTDNQGAMLFDGVDDSNDFGNILQLGVDSRTYCCWYKRHTITTLSTSYLISKTDNNTTQYRQAYGFNSSGDFLTIFRGQSNVNYDFTLTNPRNDLMWHYAVWVIDRTLNISVYQDTDLVGIKQISPLEGQNFTITRPFRVGSYNTTTNVPSSSLNGSISHIAVYNHVLTALEIKQNFEATRDRYGV